MPMPRKSMTALLVLLFAAFAGAMYGMSAQEDAAVAVSQKAMDAGARSPSDAKGKIVVYVTGGVRSPGVYELPADSRAQALVDAAGGALETADLANCNLAQPLKDGMQLSVPERITERTASDTTAAMEAARDDRVNINTADAKALDTLPGVGPAIAQRILDHRKAHGSFQSTEELKEVRGIGDVTYEKLKDKVKI